MEYVAIGALVVVVLGLGALLFVRASRAEGGTPFSGQDGTPWGDTAEHAGEQDDSGRTVSRRS